MIMMSMFFVFGFGWVHLRTQSKIYVVFCDDYEDVRPPASSFSGVPAPGQSGSWKVLMCVGQ